MDEAWPALCTLVALVLLLVLIIRFKLNAFVALLVVSLGLGLAAGMQPSSVLADMGTGLGRIMRSVAAILALGAMLGRMLDASGAAEAIAGTLVRAFGPKRASLAILAAAYVIGIPVLFGVGFLLLIPIIFRLQRDTGRSLLWFVMPLCLSLGTTHSLVPPHPGIVGAVSTLAPGDSGRAMVQTIIFGTLMGIPATLVGWFGPARWWARRQFVAVPEHLAGAMKADETGSRPSFALSVLIVTMPLVLSLIGFGAQLAGDVLPAAAKEPLAEWTPMDGWPTLRVHSLLDWLKFVGDPVMALLVPTGLAFLLLGHKRGMSGDKLAKIAGDALQDVGGILFLFGAAGGFAEVIKATGAGPYIAGQFLKLPLSPVLLCYLVALLMRVALGSATAAILIAAGLLQAFVRQYVQEWPGREVLLILAVANGVTFMTQPADSGFWMVKEYCNLSVRDMMFRFNPCRMTMSLAGLGILLLYEWAL